MNGYYYILIFLIGLSVGSFFNVVIFRFNTGKGIVKGRSKCIKCNSVIKWSDLIPVFSYIALRGECRECKNKISLFYPVVEISTAIMFLLLFLNIETMSYMTLVNAFVILLFSLIIFFDIRYLIIPDKVLALLAAAVLLKFAIDTRSFYYLLISAFGPTLFFAILFLASKGKWIGFGDIKLTFLIGFLFGYPMGYLTIVAAVWLATIVSIILLVTKRVSIKTEIPFGAFLSITSVIFIIFSNEIQKISKYFY